MTGVALLGALGAALAGTPHCVGMCGALACAAGERPAQQLPYHLGRIGSYAALGALSGAFGHVIPGPDWVGTAVAAVLLVGFALALAGWLPEPRVRLPWLTRAGAALAGRTDGASRLLFGMVNGLLPCGLVYATLGLAVATADPVSGALLMAVFGLGTVPALAVATLGLRRALNRSMRARRALALGIILMGLGSLAWREGLFSPASAADSDVPPCHAE
jgi:sulfite exporter TauE/SafE